MGRRSRWLVPILIPFLALMTLRVAWAGPPLAGKIISTQGLVETRRGDSLKWEAAKPSQELCAGDAVRTGAGSRASILCVDESQVKLNENTVLILKSVAPSPRLQPGKPVAAPEAPPASVYQVPQGEIWLRNKREKFRFELETPAATATIRGTEINIRVRPDGSTRVTLLEGNICLANSYGEVCLRPGEEGFVLPGQAPTKQMLVNPTDAVQWSLYYPGIFSYRDLPLTPQPEETRAPVGPPTVASMVQQGETAYDQGRLTEARQAGEEVLRQDPENGRALTLLGWISLQRHAPEEALSHFRQVRAADERAIVGAALCRYRLGELAGAYDVMRAAYRLRPNPALVSMAGYFALLAGRVEQARAALENAIRQTPEASLPRALLAQIYLVQNRKDAALTEASQALSQAPGSPLALLTMALVKMAHFDLPAATQYLQKALATDPGFVDAHVYLARIWLASEYLARAQKEIDRALRLAPQDGTVLSLAGFIRLAYRDYTQAKNFFTQALQINPRLGEPHLGLAIYHFRYRNFDQGLEGMLTATLLEPRVSLYQSSLGKALYQTRAFDKAMEVFDYAKTLDPQDPTPHLYKGIALTDLNRPGEAIEEINRSIALNDNTAIFRSRSGLDRDLAVRNYNLARSYDQLRLGEWAYSKAITALKKDPSNSSAHLFLEKSYQSTGQGVLSQGAEDLISRLLAPANQSTFSNRRNDDYTPMFEMPHWRLLAQGGIGAWSNRNSIQEHFINLYGGLPGTSFSAEVNYEDDRGMRLRNSDSNLKSGNLVAKWEPTVHGSLLGSMQYAENKVGDLSFLNDFNFENLKRFRFLQRPRLYEAGYVHRFNPQSTLIAYYSYQTWQQHADLFSLPPPFVGVSQFVRSDLEFNNFQLQKHLILGNHTFIGGFDYFAGHLKYRERVLGLNFDFRPPERAYSFYLLDYWRLLPQVVIELGVIKDFSKNSRGRDPNSLYTSLWNPIVGINYQVNSQHTLRFAAQRHLLTHNLWGPSLLPTETAGFPWLIDLENGTVVREIGASWEAQWNSKTFSVLRLDAHRFDTPNLEGVGNKTWDTWKRYLASFTVNRILVPSLGLSAGVMGKRVVPDPNANFQSTFLTLPSKDFSEFRAFLGLAFLHHTGWQAGVKTTLVQQNLKDRGDNLFGLVDARFGKELANKRGLATLEITNIFNRRFFHALDPGRALDPEFFPARRILFKLALYY